MRICFIANYQKTLFFQAISKVLREKSAEIFWITINKEQSNLISKDTPKENTIRIDKSILKSNNRPIGDFKIKELVFGDRCLKHESWGIEFLEKIQEPLYNFIHSNKIDIIIGELTWAHEILAFRIINGSPLINTKFLNPHTIRIPSKRFAFFTNEFQSEILEISKKTETQPSLLKLEAIAPDYLKLNDLILKKSRSLSSRLQKIINFLTRWKKDFNDPTLTTSHFKTLTKRLKEETNKELYKIIPRRKFTNDIKDLKYVLLTLHKQPEASIDVIGRYYENQLENISIISRALPKSWKIIVKEHTNAVGDRSILFFWKLLKDPAIILINEEESSFTLMEHAQLVITVSGTIAYEAAIKGIPSLTFADTFFNRLGRCKKLTIEDIRNYEIPDLIKKIKKTDTGIKSFTSWISQNSFEGIISDPTSNPECMSKDNIEKVSNAISLVYQETKSLPDRQDQVLS
jgi:hypothetical protein